MYSCTCVYYTANKTGSRVQLNFWCSFFVADCAAVGFTWFQWSVPGQRAATLSLIEAGYLIRNAKIHLLQVMCTISNSAIYANASNRGKNLNIRKKNQILTYTNLKEKKNLSNKSCRPSFLYIETPALRAVSRIKKRWHSISRRRTFL